MRDFGIDISTFQNGINLSEAKKEGCKFVIIRGAFTGYGINKRKAKDDRFESHYKTAKDNNLDVGVYYFSRATNYSEGKKEAEFLYNNCLKGKTFEYPIYIDVEDDVYQIKANKKDITEAIKGFCEYIESVGGYVGVYCNLDWANNKMNYNELSKKYDYWLAYWGKYMPNRDTYGNYGIWQYGGETNLIRENKIGGKVTDQNYSYKDYRSIMKYNKLNNWENKSDDNTTKNITYIVKPGDSLSSIADKYNTTWQKIYSDNKKVIGSNPNLIYSGQKLIIK